MKKRYLWITGLFGFILIGAGSWAFYGLINQGASDLLGMFGFQNFYLQTLIVILVVIFGLMFSGFSIWKAFEKMVKG